MCSSVNVYDDTWLLFGFRKSAAKIVIFPLTLKGEKGFFAKKTRKKIQVERRAKLAWAMLRRSSFYVKRLFLQSFFRSSPFFSPKKFVCAVFSLIFAKVY